MYILFATSYHNNKGVNWPKQWRGGDDEAFVNKRESLTAIIMKVWTGWIPSTGLPRITNRKSVEALHGGETINE